MSSLRHRTLTPVMTGAVAGLLALGSALAVVVVPALIGQLAATRSSMGVLEAVLIALNVLVIGHGGSSVLDTGVISGAFTLTPLGLMLVFIALTCGGMRRVGRRLELVEASGSLRTRAVRDAAAALGAQIAVYAGGLGLLAALGRSTEMAPVVPSAVVSGALVATLGGLGGLALAVRRDGSDGTAPVRIVDLFPRPFDAIARAGLIALLSLGGLGLLAVVAMICLRLSAVANLFAQLEPGIGGGIVLTLLQLALLPLAAVWALVVLLGGSVTLGTGTALSLGGFDTGVMPLVPLLGALPEPGRAPAGLLALMALPALAVGLGAVRLARDMAGEPLRERLLAFFSYPVVVVLGVLLAAGLATGGIGDGRLAHLGPQVRELIWPLLGITAGATALVLGVLASGLIPALRRGMAGMRQMIEAAEAKEAGVPTGTEDPAEAGPAHDGSSDGGSDADPSGGDEQRDTAQAADDAEPIAGDAEDAEPTGTEPTGTGSADAGPSDRDERPR
ncbi:cell division protein PerM [Brachybacterium hainanense]|uniref:DUF6350 family protein n=1 Tax=Brachybacterium hainanense TaxID=1541174 RepID=A0ABV6RFQ2_9MICO